MSAESITLNILRAPLFEDPEEPGAWGLDGGLEVENSCGFLHVTVLTRILSIMAGLAISKVFGGSSAKTPSSALIATGRVRSEGMNDLRPERTEKARLHGPPRPLLPLAPTLGGIIIASDTINAYHSEQEPPRSPQGAPTRAFRHMEYLHD